MRVGLTYDLRDEYVARGWSRDEAAEFDSADTIDALVAAMGRLGHEADRIGSADALARRLLDGERWDLVFNIAESFGGVGREALVPALLDYYAVPYTFADPLVCALTLDKAMCKRALRDMGIPTPDFEVVKVLGDLQAVGLAFPVFAKPAQEGSSKGISSASLCRTPEQLADRCRTLLDQFSQPVLVERYLPGREVTVSIVGTGDRARVLGVMEITLRETVAERVYSYDVKQDWEDVCILTLAADEFARACEGVALQAYRGLGLQDAGRVDIRADEHGRPMVIELNPLPGLNPDNSDLPITCRLAGFGYDELIGAILDSAAERQTRGGKAARAGTCVS
ncbi:MAG: ATP-grasp domain-containing protein [Phycisphaerales bacterium]|nr:ATP-grasp domain-containing protein [Phycisphaerales bacterium]